ncbi:TldD/PmbA family protein [Candidatus Micrarchaeota archaeon]|nr:TldD/PmbA family protein [Candidatus Micrarchaeota archaeon]
MDFEKLLSNFHYAELRIEKSVESSVNIKDGEIKHSSGSSYGISVRVLENGSWGFASGNSGINVLLDRAKRLAKLSTGEIKLTVPKAEKKQISVKHEFAEPEEKIKALLEGSKAMEGVSSRMLGCTDLKSKVEFYNSAGAEITQELGYTYLSCSSVAKENGIIQRGSERDWSRTGFDEINTVETAEKASKKALRLVRAAPSPKGRFTVVLDPEMTGVFAHEAVGHACEADAVVDKESILADSSGKPIGNELVTIIDDPLAEDFGQYTYDDEGVKAKTTVLIDHGKVNEFINSMETANTLGAELNGHARAEDYSQVPIVRMSNTYFQKGESSKEEVFELKKGVYLKGMRGGSVDTFSGGFMFKAEEAYEISNGELGKIMRDVTITGNILQTMKEVEAVGKDFGTSPGICGKFGQGVPVSDGGPHIRVGNITIG